MTRRLHVLLATVCLTSAFAAGAVYWTGTFVFGQEDKPAKTNAAAAPAATPQAAGAAKKADGGDAANGRQTGHVSVKDFSHLVADGDWSPAIQAAIDHASAKNGYENGTTILFPPGTYLVNQTIRLGKDRAHYGTRLSGYGAVLKGTKILDAQSMNYEEREKALTKNSPPSSTSVRRSIIRRRRPALRVGAAPGRCPTAVSW